MGTCGGQLAIQVSRPVGVQDVSSLVIMMAGSKEKWRWVGAVRCASFSQLESLSLCPGELK